MSPSVPPSTGLIDRFGLFIDRVKRAIADGIGRDHARRDHARLGPLAVLLWNYFGRTLRRLAALQARLAAGTLETRDPRRSAAPRPAADRPAPDVPAPRRWPLRLPRAAVLVQFQTGHLVAPLQALIADPEMLALLAAAPQAGRLLRPLWRLLTPDPLPPQLRLPPRRSGQCRPSGPREPDTAPPHGPPRWLRRATGRAAPGRAPIGRDLPLAAVFAGLTPRRPRTS